MPRTYKAARLLHHLLLDLDIGSDICGLCRARRFVLDAFCSFSPEAHLEVAAKLDVGAAARHVGCNGNGARYAGIRDDMGLSFVMPGIQDFVLNFLFLQKCRQFFRLLDANRADEDGLSALVAFRDLICNRVVFSCVVR